MLDRLQGLEYRHGPSLVRDAVSTVLGAGAPSVDVMIGRVVGGKPWDFDDDRVFRVLDGYLADLAGTLLVFPDFSGPVQRLRPPTEEEEEQRLQRLKAALGLYGPGWSERYQIALIDDPRFSDALSNRALPVLLGNDVTVCRWEGSERALREHGWRSAGAATLGLLASGNRGLLGLTGQVASVGQPRLGAPGRHELLRRTDPVRETPAWAEHFLTAELSDENTVARIVREPTFRRPLGAWPFSALRMVKAIHQRLVEAASHFVFQPADPRSAMALGAALQSSIRPFVDFGLLGGPEEAGGEPVIAATINVQSDGSRALLADVMGNLRPWSRRVAVRVSLRPNESPSLEAL